MMADIISTVIVIVFVLIVFRKRLAFLFRNKKKSETEQTLEDVADSLSDMKLQVPCFEVYAFDVSIYLNPKTLCLDVSICMNNELDRIRCKGEIINIDVYSVGNYLIFLVRWKAYSGESE